MHRQIRQLSLLVLALTACTKDKPTAPPAEMKAPAAEVKSADAENYSVKLSPKDAYSAGQPGSAAVTIASKNGFHVNPEYPVAFKPEGSQGVTFADERVRLENGTRTPCEANAEDACKVEFALPVTPEKAGTATVAGVLAFSVCSADKCLIEKVPLTLAFVAN